MKNKLESGFFQGVLYTKESENRISSVVLRTGDFDLELYSGIGGGMKFNKEDDIKQDNNNSVYYPYYNETVANLNLPLINKSEFNKILDNAYIKYYILNNRLFISSQLEVTAYTPNYFTFNNNIYKIKDPLIVEGGNEFKTDELIGFEGSKNVIRVQNVQTEITGTVKREKIDNIINNEEPNGLIEVNKDNNYIDLLINKIS